MITLAGGGSYRQNKEDTGKVLHPSSVAEDLREWGFVGWSCPLCQGSWWHGQPGTALKVFSLTQCWTKISVDGSRPHWRGDALGVFPRGPHFTPHTLWGSGQYGDKLPCYCPSQGLTSAGGLRNPLWFRAELRAWSPASSSLAV